MSDEKKVNPVIDDENEKRWYVVNTYSGHENRVKDNLEKRVESMGIQDSLFRVLVAEEPEIEIKNGKEVEKMRNIFPGYVFVEMKMTDEAWYVVRNTPGVTGFIGSSGGGAKPFPVSPDEIESILRRMGQSDKKVVVDFKVGDTVRILTGPFTGMEGRVSEMNDQTQVASIMTMLFGRETPTDINYNDLQKVED
ncbi:MAG: transcription termination/antitermination protein NusG [Erysipelotrichaceae bacterium]|nr:transcription termination/antitermination protein NusG [Erysipelotrichaceae bacterium]